MDQRCYFHTTNSYTRKFSKAPREGCALSIWFLPPITYEGVQDTRRWFSNRAFLRKLSSAFDDDDDGNAYSADIERDKQKAREVRAALDEQIQRKRDLLAQKTAQEAEYIKEQEVRRR